MDVRVRFAPSPTGHLHIGGLRTALFNYLFARKHGGTFILRIEDTDQDRFDSTAEKNILRELAWTGIIPDESPVQEGEYGPYRQSERLGIYRDAVEELLNRNKAYKCYCTVSELEAMRKRRAELGRQSGYDGRCRDLTDKQRQKYDDDGYSHVVRMRVDKSESPVILEDMIRGRVQFSLKQQEDQVIMKTDGYPTYHLAAVMDDSLMEISHVLRGEEWLPSIPKYILLCRWLDIVPPQFAHLPLILNPDRSKMSKRGGDFTVGDFARKGYLPQALINFLALLGWNPGNEEEVFSVSDLESIFDVKRIGKSPAKFNSEKLGWINKIWIDKLGKEALWHYLIPFVTHSRYGDRDMQEIRELVPIIQPQMSKLVDIEQGLNIFYRPEQELPSDKIIEILGHRISKTVLTCLLKHLNNFEAEEFNAESFNKLINRVGSETSFKGKPLLMPMRMAITLEAEGPDLAQVASVFGRAKVAERVERSLQIA